MATEHEKLAASLAALKRWQDTSKTPVLHGATCLGRMHTERLLKSGFLQRIIKGWHITSSPDSAGETTAWYSSYWHFVAAYCNSRFGNDWSLTAEESLLLNSGECVVPKQLLIRAKKGDGNILQLPDGCSLLTFAATLPGEPMIDSRWGLRIYSREEALLFASPGMFLSHPIEVQAVLASIEDVSEILRMAIDTGASSRAGRIAGAFRAIGRDEFASEIVSKMRQLGWNVQECNPFEFDKNMAIHTESPAAARLRLAWRSLRGDVIECRNQSGLARRRQPLRKILDGIDARYALDSYHSLSIEGYQITEGLLDRVCSGEWNPDTDSNDRDKRDALAARGYYQAYQSVRKAIEGIFDGNDVGETLSKGMSEWHFQLFEPCARAGIVKMGDLVGWRRSPVFIRGSRHTPLPASAVADAMKTFSELLCEENDNVVRAVLGHFFFVNIHPYLDGNGRTARFLMNVALVADNRPWRIISVDQRSEYLSTLETASAEGDIRPFARFILG